MFIDLLDAHVRGRLRADEHGRFGWAQPDEEVHAYINQAGGRKKFKGDQMRNVIFAINITLDGCCDHTKHVPDEGVMEYYTRLLRDDAGLLVYGRKTSQLMVPY